MLTSMDIGSRLTQERKRLRFSQEVMAEAGGVVRRTQSAYEAGESAPNLEYLANIAAHGVDVVFILTGQATSAGGNEAELLRLFRSASTEVQRVVFAALGAAFGNSQEASGGVTIEGNNHCQIISGGQKVKTQTLNIGAPARKKKGKND